MGRPLPIVEAGVRPADALEQEGWERRFVAVGSRLDEAAALYRQLGFMVRLEPPTAADLREECSDCRLALESYRVLYTRRSL
jgi:hypothetical protein